MLTEKQAIGLRLKEFREKANLTQDKLADMVGIDSKHLSRIENGRNYPSFTTLEKLVESLNITFEDIFQTKHFESREILLENLSSSLQNLPESKLRFIYKMVKEI